jgi:hypothetical protein
VGLGLFLFVVPSAVIGPQFNFECLRMWSHRMVTPFVVDGHTSPQEVNQSVPGVLKRLLEDLHPGPGRYDTHFDLNLISLPPWIVNYLIKGIAALLLGMLALLCRTRATDRRDPRLLGEIALVVLTMLFVSERSWKHHYVTVLIPYSYLVAEFFSSRIGPRSRMLLVGSWAVSFVLMAATSTELGGLFYEGQGHEIAQGYGSFLWAGVVLYATVAWRVWVRRSETPVASDPTDPVAPTAKSHFAFSKASRSAVRS